MQGKRNAVFIDSATFEAIRRLAFERRCSLGRIVAEAVERFDSNTAPIIFEVSGVTDDGADEDDDPRSAAEREQDAAAADWAGQVADLRGGL